LKSGSIALELPSLTQLEDGEKELNIEAYWNTFKVGIGEGIKMLKLGPMKNNLNLKFGNNMESWSDPLLYMKNTKDWKFLKIQVKSKISQFNMGWIFKLSRTIKQILKTRQIHQVAIQTHYTWIMKSLKKLCITSISNPLQ